MKKLAVLIFVVVALIGQSQTHYKEVVNKVLEVRSPYRQYEAQRMAAEESPILDAPEVEYSHFWGAPSEVGNRWDLRVSQGFPFPTTMVHQLKSRKLAVEESVLQFDADCSALVLETQEICSELVFYNASCELYGMCVANAQNLVDVYERRMAAGDCSVIDFNRAQMNLVTCRNKLSVARATQSLLLEQLRALVGNSDFTFEQSCYEGVELPTDFEHWFDSVMVKHPQLLLIDNKVRRAQEELRVVRSQWLPSLSVGYASETVTGEAFRGVTVGASLPIWSNARRSRAAAAHYDACVEQGAIVKSAMEGKYRGLFAKALSLQQNLVSLQQSLLQYNSDALLLKALDAGELTLESYLLAVDFYNDAQLSVLESQKEFEQTYLELVIGLSVNSE